MRGDIWPPSWLRYWSLMKFGPLIPMNTAFPVVLEKICLNVSKCFHVHALTNHLHIINFTEIRASF